MRRTGPRKSTAAILSLASVCLLLASPQELTLLKGLLSVRAEKTPEAGCVMLNVRSQDNDSDWHVDHGPCWLGPLCYPPLAVLLVLTFKDWSVTFHSSLGFWPLWHVKMEDCVTSPRALQQEEQTWETQFLMTLTNKVWMRKLSAVLCGLSIYKFSSIFVQIPIQAARDLEGALSWGGIFFQNNHSPLGAPGLTKVKNIPKVTLVHCRQK